MIIPYERLWEAWTKYPRYLLGELLQRHWCPHSPCTQSLWSCHQSLDREKNSCYMCRTWEQGFDKLQNHNNLLMSSLNVTPEKNEPSLYLWERHQDRQKDNSPHSSVLLSYSPLGYSVLLCFSKHLWHPQELHCAYSSHLYTNQQALPSAGCICMAPAPLLSPLPNRVPLDKLSSTYKSDFSKSAAACRTVPFPCVFYLLLQAILLPRLGHLLFPILLCCLQCKSPERVTTHLHSQQAGPAEQRLQLSQKLTWNLASGCAFSERYPCVQFSSPGCCCKTHNTGKQESKETLLPHSVTDFSASPKDANLHHQVGNLQSAAKPFTYHRYWTWL